MLANGPSGIATRCLSYAGGKVPATTANVINGQFLDSKVNKILLAQYFCYRKTKNHRKLVFQADRWIDVHNPATNEVLTKVPHSTQDEMNEAVAAAKVHKYLMFDNTKR